MHLWRRHPYPQREGKRYGPRRSAPAKPVPPSEMRADPGDWRRRRGGCWWPARYIYLQDVHLCECQSDRKERAAYSLCGNCRLASELMAPITSKASTFAKASPIEKNAPLWTEHVLAYSCSRDSPYGLQLEAVAHRAQPRQQRPLVRCGAAAARQPFAR